MALGIYKPGQGYWVRVLTAAFAGTLVLVAAAWLWNQLETSQRIIPIRAYVMSTSQPASFAAPGQEVALLGAPKPGGEPADSLGTAKVVSTSDRSLRIEPPRKNAGVTIGQVQAVAPPAGGAPPVPVRGTPIAERAFEPIYIQAAGVAALMLAGSLLIYWFVAAKPRSVEFLIATDGEMKKVNWSTRRDIMTSTWVVILWAFLIAGGLFIVDYVFATFFTLIGILQS
jgi:preprotein translocase SecE subunit